MVAAAGCLICLWGNPREGVARNLSSIYPSLKFFFSLLSPFSCVSCANRRPSLFQSTLRRCELLNAEGVAVTNIVYGTTLPKHPTLFLEFAGEDPESLARDAEVAHGFTRSHGALGWQYATDGASLDELWDARRGCYLAAARRAPLVLRALSSPQPQPSPPATYSLCISVRRHVPLLRGHPWPVFTIAPAAGGLPGGIMHRLHDSS